MEYPDWNWSFHGEIIEENNAEIIMRLVRCLSRNPECEFKHQQPHPWWIEPAQWLDSRQKIIRIPKVEKCDYAILKCNPCDFFRRLWESRLKPWHRALKCWKSNAGKMSFRQRHLQHLRAKNRFTGGQISNDGAVTMEQHQT